MSDQDYDRLNNLLRSKPELAQSILGFQDRHQGAHSQRKDIGLLHYLGDDAPWAPVGGYIDNFEGRCLIFERLRRLAATVDVELTTSTLAAVMVIPWSSLKNNTEMTRRDVGSDPESRAQVCTFINYFAEALPAVVACKFSAT